MLSMPHLSRLAAAALSLMLAAGAQAHDTWFAPATRPAPGNLTLLLGTGNQFPLQEFGLQASHLEQLGCQTHQGQRLALLPQTETGTALSLRVGGTDTMAGQPLTCWAQLVPFEIEIAPAQVAVYLREIRAPQSAQDTWAGLQARGVGWKERYVKNARVELGAAAAAAEPRPVSLGLDVLLDRAGTTLRPGDALSFRVLRDGVPFPGFNVELRGDRSPIGFWRQTDAQGRVTFTAPLPGHWVLRGTDLRISAERPDTWDSRFVTLAFEIGDGLPRTAAP